MRIKLIVISILLASCSSISLPSLPTLVPHKPEIQQGNMITPEMQDKVKVGMSSAMVHSILGTPLVMDPFHARRWDYVYSLEKGGKLVEKQRLTLFFEDEHLVRIDNSNMPAGVTSGSPLLGSSLRFPLPQAGEEANESLRELHAKEKKQE